MSRPLFTVVVTTYNRPRFLLQAVESLLAQTERSLEVLVVDDASPEPPPPLPDDERLRLIRRHSKGGAAAARNTGIASARGKHITFLDDDDLLQPYRLADAKNRLGDVPVIVCWAKFMDGKPAPQRILNGNVHDEILEDYTPHVGTTVVHRDHILPFDEGYMASQDIEWWLRISRDFPVATVAKVGYLIRRHPGDRHLNGIRQRIRFGQQLLADNPEYFAQHKKAAGFRLWRIGSMSMTVGDLRTARSALARSLLFRPRPGTARRLLTATGRSLLANYRQTLGPERNRP